MSAARTAGKIFGILLLIIGLMTVIGSYSMSQVTGPEAIKSVVSSSIPELTQLNQSQLDVARSGLSALCNATGSTGVTTITPEMMQQISQYTGQQVPNISLTFDCAKVPTMTASDIADIASNVASEVLKSQITCSDFITCISQGQIAVLGTTIATQFFMTMVYVGLLIAIIGLVIIIVALRDMPSILKAIGPALLVSGIMLLIASLVAPNIVPAQAQQIAAPILGKLTSITMMAGIALLVIGIVLLVAGIVTGKKGGASASTLKKRRSKGEFSFD